MMMGEAGRTFFFKKPWPETFRFDFGKFHARFMSTIRTGKPGRKLSGLILESFIHDSIIPINPTELKKLPHFSWDKSS
jgi:hypothetical protein